MLRIHVYYVVSCFSSDCNATSPTLPPPSPPSPPPPSLPGSTGERIVLAGDSAGGQLAITLAMKLKQLGIRLPHRVLSVYPALNLSTTVSPSKVTALLDPLLPLGVLISILQVCVWLDCRSHVYTMYVRY